MVRFVTTAYTHMYENDYVGLPGEKYRRKTPNELTDVGIRVEKWRKEANLKVAALVARTNEMLARRQHIDDKTYWAFVRGQQRITTNQIRAIAKTLGVTVHIMTHYSPGQVPETEAATIERRAPSIKVHGPARRAELKRRAQGKPKPKSKLTSQPRPYDADEAAKLLAQKFGDKVKRDKRV